MVLISTCLHKLEPCIISERRRPRLRVYGLGQNKTDQVTWKKHDMINPNFLIRRRSSLGGASHWTSDLRSYAWTDRKMAQTKSYQA